MPKNSEPALGNSPDPAKVVKARIRRIYSAIYPRTAEQQQADATTPAGQAQQLIQLLNNILDADTHEMGRALRTWPQTPPPELRLVRKGPTGELEASEPLTTPRTPEQLMNALEAYIAGKSWDEVKLISTERPGKNPAEMEAVRQLQIEASAATSLMEAGLVAVRINTGLTNQQSINEAMRTLHRRAESIIEDSARNLTDLKQLEALRTQTEAFLASEHGRYFVRSMLLDFLDAAALRIGRAKVAKAQGMEEMRRALDELRAHPFQFAEAYEAQFDESRDDVLAKFDLLDELRRIRSVSGLDAFKTKVASFPFKSSELSPALKSQIDAFIERKRAVYAPTSPDGETLRPLTDA